MTISGNYATPVVVNGFQCKNCTDVDNAKKHIDPAHPQDGPFGIDRKNDPNPARADAVTFGGALAGLATGVSQSSRGPVQTSGLSTRVDISV